MRGRKPKPTHLKLVTGNPGKRKLNREEPQPHGAVIRPKFLKHRAARIWDEYAPQLVAIGVLTAIDVHTFAAWCSLSAELERNPAAMPASRITQLRTIGSLFGLDPSSRSRIHVPTPAGGKKERAEEDPAAEFFAS